MACQFDSGQSHHPTMIKLILTLLAFLALNATAKPLIIYTSYPVGSGPDNFVRQVTEVLSKQLEITVILENKPGGNGAVALATFNKLPADGNSILFTGLDILPTMPMINGDAELIKDLKLLAPGFHNDLILIASASVNTIADLQRVMAEHPLYGSWAIGSSSHLFGEQFARYFKVNADHAPYKDFNAWYIDVSNQQLAFSFGTIASGTALERAGRIKFLAVASQHRDPTHPEIPTLDEFVGRKTGITGPFTGAAFYVNKNTPQLIEAQLRTAVITALQSAEVQQKIAALNYRSWTTNTKEVNKTLDKNLIKYQQLVRQLNINLRQ